MNTHVRRGREGLAVGRIPKADSERQAGLTPSQVVGNGEETQENQRAYCAPPAYRRLHVGLSSEFHIHSPFCGVWTLYIQKAGRCVNKNLNILLAEGVEERSAWGAARGYFSCPDRKSTRLN